MKNIYLCGPVSGRPRQEAVEHFDTVEKRISAVNDLELEIITLNPMRFCPAVFNWYQSMRVCVGELASCSGIALLQGWQRSRGAAIEIKLAQDLHIPVVYIEPPVDFIGINELFIAAPESLRYYNARLAQFHTEGIEEPQAEDRALAELVNRYLDPQGFEYIENLEG